MKKRLLVLATALALMLTATACGREKENGPQIDPNKTQVYISLYSGGFGYAWLDEFLEDYNAGQTEYQFIRLPENKNSMQTTVEEVKSGVAAADIYFHDSSDFYELTLGGYLEELTSVWQRTPEGEEQTVAEKIQDAEMFRTAYGDGTGKVFGLPYTQGLSGVIYDHDLLKSTRLLAADSQTENGLTLGRDGKPGTYDDGLPVTYQEFVNLLKSIGQFGVPIIYSDIYQDGLVQPVADAVWAMYDGYANWELAFTYDGTYVSPSTGSETKITPDKGYLVWELAEGRFQAARFMNDILDNPDYISDKTGISHLDSEGEFVLSHNTSKPIAMMVNGVWWENEARRYFSTDVNRNGEEYAYGKRDFRLMPLPAYPNSKDGDKTAIACQNNGSVIVLKQKDDGKRRAIMDFLTAYCSDKGLKCFTRNTSAILPYRYEMTPAEQREMTPFGRNLLEILSGGNALVLRQDLLIYRSKINYLAANAPRRWDVTVGGNNYGYAFSAIQENGLDAYCKAVAATYTAKEWKRIYDSVA